MIENSIYSFLYKLQDIRVLDLYGGAGFSAAGLTPFFHITDMVDCWKIACNSYKANHTKTRVREMQVSDFINQYLKHDFDGLLLNLSNFLEEKDNPFSIKSFKSGARGTGIAAYPPCKDFSVLNQKADIESDRAMQLFIAVEAVKSIRPDFVLIENVKSVPKIYKEKVCAELLSMGYKVWSETLRASDFGNVQIRERWITICHKNRLIKPIPVKKRKYARDILTNATKSEISGTPSTFASLQGLPKAKWVARKGQRSSYRNYFIIDPDKHIGAVVDPSKFRYVVCNKKGDPYRYLTLGELKLAQGVNHDYIIHGRKKRDGTERLSDITQQIGNAVPAELTYAIANAIYKAFL